MGKRADIYCPCPANNGPATAETITRAISHVSDRLVQRLLLRAEAELGPPPLPYCWIAYGSQGRLEQTFSTDQDDAIIYADPGGPEEARAADAYFGELAESVNSALERHGYSRCPGGYMARNPMWRRPLGQWKGYFSGWIETPTPEAVLYSLIVFDFRPVHGESRLASELRGLVTSMARSSGMFLKHMADRALEAGTPMGPFGYLRVERKGPNKGKLDLKTRLAVPIINMVRLMALEQGIGATSTHERLRAMAGTPWASHIPGLSGALEFFMLMRLMHQFGQIEAGGEPDNFMDPSVLTRGEIRKLREFCQAISSAKRAIRRKYCPGTIM